MVAPIIKSGKYSAFNYLLGLSAEFNELFSPFCKSLKNKQNAKYTRDIFC
ncbi:hypothetical protein [Campylobacter portucalensis]|nr:hypothetical protein [Campylobacter portucalensis]